MWVGCSALYWAMFAPAFLNSAPAAGAAAAPALRAFSQVRVRLAVGGGQSGCWCCCIWHAARLAATRQLVMHRRGTRGRLLKSSSLCPSTLGPASLPTLPPTCFLSCHRTLPPL